MSTALPNAIEIQHLATYGTLRDDDDSGATWTQKFIEGVNPGIFGKVSGYRLYGHSTHRYPVALRTDDPKDVLVVRLLSWPSKAQFDQKIIDADEIEGEPYERLIVPVVVNEETVPAFIYVYRSAALAPEWTVIPTGDWLQRPLK